MRFVGYLRGNDDIRNLLSIQMDQHQLLIGSCKHFLELSSNDYPYEESSRIKLLWERNTHYTITVHVQGAWNQRLVRHHDVFLIDKICNEIRRPEVLIKLNNVRLYLKGSRLNEIVTEDGQWIHNWATHGPSSNSEFKLPKRRKLLEQNMRLFRDTIQ